MIDLMTPEEVAEKLKMERRKFLRTVANQPGFPAPVRLSKRILRWHAEDIDTWVDRSTRRAA
jgi:predicted DNA-binding transcriptional regulator AlpA